MSSQNSPIILSKSSKRNQRKKELRAIKKAKIKNPNNSIIGGDDSTFNSSANQIKERTNIFYDSLKHKVQSETCKLTKEETQQYVLFHDLRPSNYRQSTVYTDPWFTFLEKFIEKRWQRLVVQELLDQGVLSSHHLNIISDVVQKKLYEDDYNDKKTLAPQKSEVFNHTSLVNPSTKKLLWKEFALWLYFTINPKFVQQFCHHCSHLWSQVNHIYRCVEAQDKPLEGHNIQETLLWHPSDKLYIAKETTKIVASGINHKGYCHIFNPQCFTNILGKTIVDFFDIDKISAMESEVAVDNYYKHML
ncbi:17081_t:CDS:2, partial [Gigaspora margarita]